MLENYDAIVDVLTVCGTSAEVDGNTCVEASGLLQKVENAKFLFIAYTVRHILELLRPADQILQARASHLLTGITVVSACITSIKALRSHDHIQKLVVKIEKQGIQLNATSVSKRKRRMPTALAQCVVETTLGNHDGDFDDVRTELLSCTFKESTIVCPVRGTFWRTTCGSCISVGVSVAAESGIPPDVKTQCYNRPY